MEPDVDSISKEYSSSRLDMAKFILVILFVIEQRWRYVIDRDLEEDGVTSKQWLMLIVMGAGFKHAPSLQEVADAMSTTHQNVKQVASSLERRGFVTMERDEKDRRIIRLKQTGKCVEFWKSRESKDARSIMEIFDGMSDEELRTLFGLMAKLEKLAEREYVKAKGNKQDIVSEDRQ